MKKNSLKLTHQENDSNQSNCFQLHIRVFSRCLGEPRTAQKPYVPFWKPFLVRWQSKISSTTVQIDLKVSAYVYKGSKQTGNMKTSPKIMYVASQAKHANEKPQA